MPALVRARAFLDEDVGDDLSALGIAVGRGHAQVGQPQASLLEDMAPAQQALGFVMAPVDTGLVGGGGHEGHPVLAVGVVVGPFGSVDVPGVVGIGGVVVVERLDVGPPGTGGDAATGHRSGGKGCCGTRLQCGRQAVVPYGHGHLGFHVGVHVVQLFELRHLVFWQMHTCVLMCPLYFRPPYAVCASPRGSGYEVAKASHPWRARFLQPAARPGTPIYTEAGLLGTWLETFLGLSHRASAYDISGRVRAAGSQPLEATWLRGSRRWPRCPEPDCGR